MVLKLGSGKIVGSGLALCPSSSVICIVFVESRVILSNKSGMESP